jgi:hypothetical protein
MVTECSLAESLDWAYSMLVLRCTELSEGIIISIPRLVVVRGLNPDRFKHKFLIFNLEFGIIRGFVE